MMIMGGKGSGKTHLLRHLSFPLQRVQGRTGKTYSMYALTDEAYALTAARPGATLSSAHILWLQGFCQGYWVAGSVAGALHRGWLNLTATVAGDDTVLLVCRIDDPVSDPTGAAVASRLAERLLRLADGHPT